MNGIYEFEALILKNGNADTGYIEFPYNVEKEFGVKGQVKVLAKFDGTEYRGSLCRMKTEHHILIIPKNIRNKINKNAGDMVKVVIIKDTEERKVNIPDDFNEVLIKENDAFLFFEKLSFTHKKEYVNWFDEAKKPETRQKRILKAIEMLKNGIKER